VDELVHLPTGDLLEKRKGGTDVLRALGQEIIREKHSAVLHFMTENEGESAFEGAIYFKNGLPNLAIASFHQDFFGIDAFEFIQERAQLANCTISLHEANVALIYSVLDEHPKSVLQFELESDEQLQSSNWWNNVRFQTHHMRFDTKDLAAEFASLEFSRKRNERQNSQINQRFERGEAYSFPNVAQINIPPILDYLQQSGCHILEISNQPISSSHFEHVQVRLHHQHAMNGVLESIEHAMFGVEFGCIFLRDFELLSVVNGEFFALELLRSTVDLCREHRFTMFISFDVDVLDQKTTAKLLQATTQLDPMTIRLWAEHPEEIPIHSLHDEYNEEEEHWFEAQLELMAQPEGALEPQFSIGLEGGSSKVSDELRAEVTDSLKGALKTFSNPSDSEVNLHADSTDFESWNSISNHPHIQPGKYVSESKIYDDPHQYQTTWINMRKTSTKDKKKDVKIRKVQKMPQRKPVPSLPETMMPNLAPKEIGFRHIPIEQLSMPEMKKPHKLPQHVIEASHDRQERISSPQPPKLPLYMQGIGEGIKNSDYVSNATFPQTQSPSKLKFDDSSKDAIQTHLAEDHSSPIPSREKSTYTQQKKSLDEISEKWALDVKKSQSNSQALYDENGRKLKFFGSET
jgi:hypothetical protein